MKKGIFLIILIMLIFFLPGCQEDIDYKTGLSLLHDISEAAARDIRNGKHDLSFSAVIVEEWLEDPEKALSEQYALDSIITWNDKLYLKLKRGAEIYGVHAEAGEAGLRMLPEDVIDECSYEKILSAEIGALECLIAFPDIRNEEIYDLYAGISDYEIRPELPEQGETLESFVPDYWLLLEWLEGDFNNDGCTDIIGILVRENFEHSDYPRILFCLSGTDTGYELSFANYDLLRDTDNGGAMNDPYDEFRVSDTTFTIAHSNNRYSRGSYEWREEYSFACIDGIWYMTEKVREEFYLGIRCEYDYNNYAEGYTLHESWDVSDIWDYEIPAPSRSEKEENNGPVSMDLLIAMDDYKAAGIGSVQVSYGILMGEETVSPPWAYNAVLTDWDEETITYTFPAGEYSYLAVYHTADKRIEILEKL